MTTFARIIRQLFFGAVYLFLAIGIVYWSYGKFFPTLPSCGDGIQNQDETGIDCGGVCEKECPPAPLPSDVQNIQIAWVKAVASDVNAYDLAAKIINPNKYWGIESFNYEIDVKDKASALILVKTGKAYILPDSYDYIIIPSQKIDAEVGGLDIKLTQQKWRSVSEDYSGVSSVSLPIKGGQYGLTEDKSGTVAASGILANKTPYDFDKIDIKIVLLDSAGELLGANVLDMRAMFSGEERYFRSIWSTPPKGMVSSVDFKATANIFNSQNFMRRYGTEEKFQQR